MISILIPTHNHICIDLVQAIHLQAENSHYPFEIIVADDASTDLQAKKANRLIGEMQGCSYIELNQNIGPARIRNFLVSQAKYSYILLMDADTFPAHPRFLTDYIQSARPDSIICGGFVYERTSTPKMCQLRYKYGIRVEETSAQERNRNPYDKFISMWTDQMRNNPPVRDVFELMTESDIEQARADNGLPTSGTDNTPKKVISVADANSNAEEDIKQAERERNNRSDKAVKDRKKAKAENDGDDEDISNMLK